ncbi:MAG: ABC-type multidrug transport system, ATPase and permease component, partial [Clostridia bacterium]|nr:ABC-type multidrug transport system, ATPase and permease component [Clostridia bacterium]
VQSFSFAETDKFSTGSLVTRLTNDVTQLQTMLMMALRMFIRAPFMCFGGIIMALVINIRFGVILAVTIPLMFILVTFIIMKANPIFLSLQKKLDKLNSVLQENLSGIRVIKAFVREKNEINRFSESNADLTKTSLKVMRLMAIISPLMMLIMNGTVIAVIYMGGFQVDAKLMEVGQVMAVATYMMQILMSLMMMSMMFMNISRAKASMDRIKEVMNTNPTITDGNEKDIKVIEGSIKFDNISFNYPSASGDPVLKNINLEIKQGEIIAFLGSTGSGKTSLINLIPRFYDATEGNIFIDGKDVKDYTLENLREKIGMVLQETVLFTGTIIENIKWGNPDATDDMAIEAAKTAQADDFITSFTEGYNTILGQRGLSLSGGQKQRLSIARAILKNPKILILDDSTSALDMGTEARLQKALKANMQSMTMIIIAQRISSVMSADRIVVLDSGRISDVGTHEELINKSEIYKDIYDSQVGEGGMENGR